MRTQPKALLTILILAACSTAAPGKDIKLLPGYEFGTTVKYESQSIIKQLQQVELTDFNQECEIHTEAGMTLKVTNVASNGYTTFEWTIDFIALATEGEITGIDEKLDFDSRRPRQSMSPLTLIMSEIIGRKVTVTISPAGEVVEAPALEYWEKTTEMDPLAAIARGVFSRRAFQQLPLFVTCGAPNPAKVRATWSRTLGFPLAEGMGSLTLSQNLEFTRIRPRQQLALIEAKGIITRNTNPASATGSAPLTFSAESLKVNKGTTRSSILWDFTTGQLHSAESTVILETTIESAVGPMQLKQNMKSAVKRVSDHPNQRRTNRERKSSKKP